MRTLAAVAILALTGCAENNLTPNQRAVLMGFANGLREGGESYSRNYAAGAQNLNQVGTFANPVHVYQPLVITPQPQTPPCCD